MQARTKELLVIISILLIAGLSIFSYRHFVLGFPALPNQSVQSWHVEAKIDVRGDNTPVKVDFFLPGAFGQYSLVDENYVSNGFGFTTRRDEQSHNRISSWTKRNPTGREIIYYRGIIYEAHSTVQPHGQQPDISIPTIGTAEFNISKNNDPTIFALDSLIKDVRNRSIDDETFALELIQFIKQNPSDSRLVQLRGDQENVMSDAALAVYIMQCANIPARVMNGVSLEQTSRHADLQSWPQLYQDGRWLSYDKSLHSFGTLSNKLPWWVGDKPFYNLSKDLETTLRISVKRHVESALTERMWQGEDDRATSYKFSIFNLPIDVQLVFAVLLPVPLGALVVCLMRQVIGVQTFGTFMPILVALAFRETQLLWGVIFFTSITMMGLVFRQYLDRLQLLLVPRLTAIMVLVVLCIYLLSVITFNLNVHSGLSISLFPLVILTMLIERVSITVDEYGAAEALKFGAGSLAVAVISYLVMSNEILSHLMVTFPELLMVVLAFIIMLGRYNGYKLSEYYRFRAFTRQDKP